MNVIMQCKRRSWIQVRLRPIFLRQIFHTGAPLRICKVLLKEVGGKGNIYFCKKINNIRIYKVQQ